MHLLLKTSMLATLILQVPEGRDFSKKLQGTWVWYKTITSDLNVGNKTKLPSTCSCSKTLEFTKDGKIRVFENDSLTGESLYKVDSIHFLKDPVRYVLNSALLSNDLSLENGNLILGQSGGCSVMEYYRPKGKKTNKHRQQR